MKRFLRNALILGALVAALATPTFARADEADDLFKQGNDAFAAKQYDAAYEKFHKAWALREGFDIAANLSVVEQQLGKKRDAAEHLDYAIENFPATGDAVVRVRMQATLQSLRAELATVTVDTDPHTIVKIDGAVVGTTPLRSKLYVEPGPHVVTGENPSKGSAEIHLECAKGGESFAELVLKPTEGLKSGGARSFIPAIIGLSVGGVGLAIGGALFGVHASQQKDAQNLGKGRVCHRGSLAADCGDVVDAQSKADRTGNAAIGTTIAGGVALGAGVGLLIWAATGKSEKPDEKAMTIVPILAPGEQGLVVGGRF